MNGALTSGTRALYCINPNDLVAVALRPLVKGECFDALTVCEDIPAGHKIALVNIAQGDKVIKYGYPIGAAARDIAAGAHVHTHNLTTLLAESPEYHYTPQATLLNASVGLNEKDLPNISVFRRRDSGSITGSNTAVGIRNEIWIIPTVGCVNRAAQQLADWARAEFAGRGSIDGAYAWTHPYGCSQMGADHEATRAILAGLARHPNAGAVLVISLGCENNTLAQFKQALGEAANDTDRIAFITAQDCEDEIAEGKKLLCHLAAHAEKAKREDAPFSDLVIGMKCGGSDGFSGITANALVGQVCDSLCGHGGTAILTEVPEMFGAEQMLMDRCESREVFDKTVALIEDFKAYYRSHNQVVYENPSPGNKAGGITTLEDKSCGCVQKSGKAPIRAVYRYGQRVSTHGLVLLEGPGNDIVSSTALTAAGAHLILFTTGRGTPLGAPAPTIKIASNSDIASRKANWIDFNAGSMLDEAGDITRDALISLIAHVASGGQNTKNEINGYREIAIFKNGVTL